MHNNYYLLRQLIPALQKLLHGATLVDAFSQNKNELILTFECTNNNQFSIVGHLDPQFTCLSFPHDFHKAKKNTAQVFKPLFNKKVEKITGFENERAFIIYFNDEHSLLFKLFGNQSNIIHYEKNKAIDMFKSTLKNDLSIKIDTLNRPLVQSDSRIINNLSNLKSVYPTLNKQSLEYLEGGIINLEPSDAVLKIRDYISQLEDPKGYYLVENKGKISLSLIEEHTIIAAFKSPIEALSSFFKLYIKKHNLATSQQVILKELRKKLARTKAYINKTSKKKEKLEKDKSYKEIADIIMANLHLIKPNKKEIELMDFYVNKLIKIKLNPKLSPQKNAEKYYNKNKNLGIEIEKLESSIISKKKLALRLESEIKKVEGSSSYRDLQKISLVKKSRHEIVMPFKVFEIDGFTVLVGKNAKNNDLLTLKHAKKNDLFFHAKDVSGSHVILKEQSNRSVPALVMEKTAALAAYYSKRKTDSLCPVGYTPKKYVRKPKGSPPGLVLVEREKVLMVKPALPT